MPQSTSAIIAARRIAGCAPDQAISSPRNLGVTFALIMTLSAGCRLEVGGILIEATGPGSGGASPTGGHTSGASTGGGESMSGGSMSSGGNPSSSASGPCMASGAEVCNDGIDNDCNGFVDCADTACASTGFVCALAIPSGWKSVAFSPTDKPGCPSGYTPVDVVSVTSTAFTCNCNCTQTSQPSCTQGTINILSNGTSGCTKTVRTPSGNGGTCGSMDLTTLKDGVVKIDPLPVTQGICGSSVSVSEEPVVQGRACMAPAVGTGCADGGACVASPQAPLVSCIASDGKQSCPSGYSKHFSVGTSAQDKRSCAPCMCATMATCTNPKLTLYADQNCMGVTHDLSVSGMCDPVNDGTGRHYDSYRYSATVTNMDCQKLSGPAPIGSLDLTGERTVCCP